MTTRMIDNDKVSRSSSTSDSTSTPPDVRGLLSGDASRLRKWKLNMDDKTIYSDGHTISPCETQTSRGKAIHFENTNSSQAITISFNPVNFMMKNGIYVSSITLSAGDHKTLIADPPGSGGAECSLRAQIASDGDVFTPTGTIIVSG